MPKIKTEPLRAQRFDNMAELRAQKVAGSYELCCRDNKPEELRDVMGVRFICPCGCDSESWCPVNGHGKPGPSWELSGTVDAATLQPSVFQSGLSCKWHGWLKNGVWESC